HHALEERAPVGVVGVLVETDDVALVSGDERRHGRDDAGPVGPVYDEAAGVEHGCGERHEPSPPWLRTHSAVAGRPPKVSQCTATSPASGPAARRRASSATNFPGPAVPMRLVSEKPYLRTIMAFAPMPNREAKARSRLMPAGPGVPTRTSERMPRCRTWAIQARTASGSKANWVMMTLARPCSASAAVLCSSAAQSSASGMSGWPSG